MLESFFGNVRPFLVPGGKVEVTMNEGPPYCNWDIVKLAAAHKLILVDRAPFRFEDYAEYTHRTTLRGAAIPAPQGNCKTYSFMPI